MIEENGIRRRMTEDEIEVEARRRTICTMLILALIALALSLPTVARVSQNYDTIVAAHTATAQAERQRP